MERLTGRCSHRTALLGSMNRQMNLPALQRIAMEFEKENDIMDQRQEMMDDAIDDATGLEDEEESEDVVNQVLDEIGIDLGQAVSVDARYEASTSDTEHSWEKRLAGCRRLQCLKAEWLKPLGVVGVLIRTMMTSRHGWIALGGERGRTADRGLFHFSSSCTNMGEVVINTGYLLPDPILLLECLLKTASGRHGDAKTGEFREVLIHCIPQALHATDQPRGLSMGRDR